jgi:hypothetical protein
MINMFNAVRTLLLNKSGVTQPEIYLPGQELIPLAYVTVPLPPYLQTIHNSLFGATPDAYMLGYRLRQFMAVLHSGPLEEYVLDKDPRITYRTDVTDFVDTTLFVPNIVQINGPSTDTLTITGSPLPPDILGKMLTSFSIATDGYGGVAITRNTAPRTMLGLTYVLTGGISPQLPLPGTGYTFTLNSATTESSWGITILTRPQYDPGQLVASVASCSLATLTSLFGGSTAVEPYKTFRNLWYDQNETPLKLGALLLAIAYRIDELRVNRA